MWREGATRGLIAVVACLGALSLAACSEEAKPTEPEASEDHDHGHDFGEAGDNFRFTLGEPAEASAAARSIEVDAVEGFRFQPASIEVKAGETVTFEVRNRDEIEHEFVLGNKDYQALHDNQMKAGGVYHNYSAYSVHVMPGETMSVTWTFQRKGRVQFACHVEGHFDQGMVGDIRIS